MVSSVPASCLLCSVCLCMLYACWGILPRVLLLRVFWFCSPYAYVFIAQLCRASYAHNYCEMSEIQGNEWPVSNQMQPVRRWGYRSLHPGLRAARWSLSGDEQCRHSLIASCFVLFHWYPWEACAFLKGNLGRGGMERRPRGVAWMYCMREE